MNLLRLVVFAQFVRSVLNRLVPFRFALVFRIAPLCFFGLNRMHIILLHFVPLRSYSCALIVLDPGGAVQSNFSIARVDLIRV